MNIYRLFLSIFWGLPLFLNATVYLEPPPDFQPKIEVVGCFLEYEDKFLLLHRQDFKPEGNLWGIPGGKMEKHESPHHALIREIGEETGFDISTQPIIDLGTVYVRYPDFDFIFHVMKCEIESPENVKISFKEHKGFTWVDPKAALKMDLMLDEEVFIQLNYRGSDER